MTDSNQSNDITFAEFNALSEEERLAWLAQWKGENPDKEPPFNSDGTATEAYLNEIAKQREADRVSSQTKQEDQLNVSSVPQSTGSKHQIVDVFEKPVKHSYRVVELHRYKIADYWHRAFTGSRDDMRALIIQLSEKLGGMGYHVETTTSAFPPGQPLEIVGVSRPLHVVDNKEARAVLNFGFLGNEQQIFASMRLLHREGINGLKTRLLGAFVLITSLIAGIFPCGFLMVILGAVNSGNAFNRTEVLFTNFFISCVSSWVMMFAVIASALIVYSYLITNDGLFLIRRSSDEIFRDDVAALGVEVLIAIEEIVDSMNLEWVKLDESGSLTFAQNMVSSNARRTSRF